MAKKRHFGSIRRRPSGRWQARYTGPDGRLHAAPDTFARKAEAQRYLSLVEAQVARGDWIDTERAKVKLADYAERWIAERPNLRPRTVELYRWLLRSHITPRIGGVQLGRLDAALVREWRADLLAAGVSESAAAKAYRLLRAVMNTAADDRIVYRNPCQIKGADRERPAERPVLTAPEVFALAAAVPARFRAMVLVAAFGSLRFGEVIALRRRDIDLDTGTITITRAYVEARGIGPVIGPPKSAAGRRTVTIPVALVDVLREHMAAHVVDAGADALVFTGQSHQGAGFLQIHGQRFFDKDMLAGPEGVPGQLEVGSGGGCYDDGGDLRIKALHQINELLPVGVVQLQVAFDAGNRPRLAQRLRALRHHRLHLVGAAELDSH